MKINIIGSIDKRVVVYPLLKVLETKGRVLVLTDDANFRRLDLECTDRKEYNRGLSDFKIVNNILDMKQEIDINIYDYIVYITTNEEIEGVDKRIYCSGYPFKTHLEREVEYKEGITKVYITDKKIKSKNTIKIPISKTIGYVWDCEEKRTLGVCIGPLADTSAKLFAKELDLDINTYKEILKKKEV